MFHGMAPRDSSVYQRIESSPAGLFLSSLASTPIERRYIIERRFIGIDAHRAPLQG
jgi:hypothetical protein